MKAIKLIALGILLLSGCSKSDLVNEQVTSRNNEIDWMKTRSYSEASIQLAAGEKLSRNETLTLAQADHCIQNEQDRPNILDVCIFLWSRGKEPSPRLEAKLLERSTQSYLAAVSLSWHTDLLRALGLREILVLKQIIGKDSTLTYLRLLKEWLSINENHSSQSINQVLDVSPDSSPAALVEYLKLAKKYDPAEYDEKIQQYCKPNVNGDIRIRCWRLIGALKKWHAPLDILQDLSIYLPRVQEQSWKIFSRLYPEFTLVLTTNGVI